MILAQQTKYNASTTLRRIRLKGLGRCFYFCNNSVDHNLANMLQLTDTCSTAKEALAQAKLYTLYRESDRTGMEDIRSLIGYRLSAALSDDIPDADWCLIKVEDLYKSSNSAVSNVGKLPWDRPMLDQDFNLIRDSTRVSLER